MKKKNEGTMYHVAEWLLIIGGLNWLLTVFDFNLVTWLLGKVPILETIVYVVVGASAAYLAYTKISK